MKGRSGMSSGRMKGAGTPAEVLRNLEEIVGVEVLEGMNWKGRIRGAVSETLEAELLRGCGY